MDHASTYRIVPGREGGLEVVQTYPGGRKAIFTAFQSKETAMRWLRGRLMLPEGAALGQWLEE